ncbi:hypothetical protein [Phytoactinopolyspora endophytica]|uniref:hypothetical protein n=1 Tax=Phytoactinopolyspora endophytica TaxID=1642495 RepID=UPI00101B8C5D|nr:hypothetical protein [Phytoactinopolyspora endophytica]
MNQSLPRRRSKVLIVAWTMFLGGFVCVALMVAAFLYFRGQGDEVGPDRATTWQSDEVGVIVRPFDPDEDSPRLNECTVTPGSGEPRTGRWFWDALAHPDHTGTATITCEDAAVFVTGTGARVLAATGGLVVMIPLVVAGIGLLLLLAPFAPVRRHSIADKVIRRRAERRGYYADDLHRID